MRATVRAELEADAPRVAGRTHGVVVASVPWARNDADHTYAFDDQVAWLATRASKSMVTELRAELPGAPWPDFRR